MEAIASQHPLEKDQECTDDFKRDVHNNLAHGKGKWANMFADRFAQWKHWAEQHLDKEIELHTAPPPKTEKNVKDKKLLAPKHMLLSLSYLDTKAADLMYQDTKDSQW